MPTPIRPLPVLVERWMMRVRVLRWLDALAAWLGALLLLAAGPPGLRWGPATLGALLTVGLLALGASLRRRWRPVSGAAGLWVSRSLAAGDLAWCVGPGSAERVIVTARRRARLTVARPGDDATEGMSVRRTRVFVVPA